MSISVAPKVNLAAVSLSILPGQTCAFDLGSITLQFRNAFLNGYLSLLGSEVEGVERRLQENLGDIQLVNTANTLLRSLNTDVLPTTLGPASVATIGTSPSYSRGDHIHGIDTSLATGFDGRYIKRSPSAENQTIQPLTDNVPLTIKSFGGTSDTLDLVNSTGAIVVSMGPTGRTTIAPSSNVVPLTVKAFPTASSHLVDLYDSAGVLRWIITNGGGLTGNSIFFELTNYPVPDFVIEVYGAGDTTSRLRLTTLPSFELGSGGLQPPDATLIRVAAGILKIGQGITNWPAGTLAQLALQGVETSNVERRIRENAGAVEITDTTPTVLRTLFPLSTAIPASVDTGGATAGTSTFISPVDHRHNLATPITAPVVINNNVSVNNPNLEMETFGTVYFLITGQGDLYWRNTVTANNDVLVTRGAAGLLLIEDSDTTNPQPMQIAIQGSEAGNVQRRMRENAGALEITDITPTVLRSLITRGAPNVTVPHNATSVAIVFSTSEADTNYKISVVPGYNTTVSYSSKATTGFTVNFGTAGPVGGSTFDWHIERIPRT